MLLIKKDRNERNGSQMQKPIAPKYGTIEKIYDPSESNSGFFCVDISLRTGGVFTEIPYAGYFGFNLSNDNPHGFWIPPKEKQEVVVLFMGNFETMPIAISGLLVPNPEIGKERIKSLISGMSKNTIGIYNGAGSRLTFDENNLMTYASGTNDANKIIFDINGNFVITNNETTHSFTFDQNGNFEVSKNDGQSIISFNDKLKVKNTTTDLLTIMDALIDILIAFKTIGSPTNHVTDPTTITQLNSYKTQIRTLIE